MWRLCLETMDCTAGVADGAPELTLGHITRLQAIAPTPLEVSKLLAFAGPKDALGNVETFFLELARVPDLQTRIAALAFQLRFDGAVEEIANNIELFQTATTQVRA